MSFDAFHACCLQQRQRREQGRSRQHHYIDMQLDAQINELISRRDKLKSDLDACEKNTRGFKIAGISTLTATGVGVVGNIKLAQEIEKQKLLKGRGGGYAGGGAGAGGTVADTQTQEQRDESSCNEFIKLGIEPPEECKK